MVHRALLTAEYVDQLDPPRVGEQWVADTLLHGFGVRLWAGKKGGGSCYAIRTRDQNGRIVREAFSIWAENDHSWWARQEFFDHIKSGEFEVPLGVFLAEARRWARDRLSVLKGGHTLAERRHILIARIRGHVESLSLDQWAQRTLVRLRRSGRNEAYVDTIVRLYGLLSKQSRNSLLVNVKAKAIAAEIANPRIMLGNSRTLQAFIGQLFSRAGRWSSAVHRVGEAIKRHCYRIRRNRKHPPYPAITKIPERDIQRFFSILEGDIEGWRHALALRLYFETGAKMKRVLSARWSHIIDGCWYPYGPDERKYWFTGKEPLDSRAIGILELIAQHQRREGTESEFLFPSPCRGQLGHIATVHRYWGRVATVMGWRSLPLSHIVCRYKERTTPSYLYSHYTFFVPIFRSVLTPELVSKVGKRHRDYISNSEA